MFVGADPICEMCGCVPGLVTLGRSSDWDRQERIAPSAFSPDWESFKNTVHGRHGRGASRHMLTE